MTPAQQQRLRTTLRESESLLLTASCGATAAPAPAQAKSSFWARLLGKKTAPSVLPAPEPADFFAITSKRVLLFSTAASAPREWFLMLGMIQEFKSLAAGRGDIIFEYELAPDGTRTPIGLLNIADAEQVRALLSSAIDAAYQASPWSV